MTHSILQEIKLIWRYYSSTHSYSLLIKAAPIMLLQKSVHLRPANLAVGSFFVFLHSCHPFAWIMQERREEPDIIRLLIIRKWVLKLIYSVKVPRLVYPNLKFCNALLEKIRCDYFDIYFDILEENLHKWVTFQSLTSNGISLQQAKIQTWALMRDHSR